MPAAGCPGSARTPPSWRVSGTPPASDSRHFFWPLICVVSVVCSNTRDADEAVMSFSLFCILALATPPGAPPPAVTALTHELHSPNTITRSRAARELGALKEEAGAAVPDLARALADVDQFVAREAAEALGKIGAAAVPALRKALWSDDARVRLRALMALSRCCPQDPPTIALLARTLKEDPDANVR